MNFELEKAAKRGDQLQVVILAGGKGTRISEETRVIPKPMIEIGNVPMIVHIMRHFASFGHKDFVIALGYRGHVIKEYFSNFHLFNSNLTLDTSTGEVSTSGTDLDDWRISLIDTGVDTLTGGRIKRLTNYLDDEFFLTYGDGLSDIDLDKLLDFHKEKECIATVTAVHPPARFGALELSGDIVIKFSEKNLEHAGWINGGFFVCSKKLLDFIEDDHTILETQPMEALVRGRALRAFRHEGFWHPLDSMRDKTALEELYSNGNTPWLKHLPK